MSDLGMYLARATEYCAETRNLIEDVIVGVQNRSFLVPEVKKQMLSDMLKGMCFSEEQLTAFANCEIPTDYLLVPVNVEVNRYYRIWVRVPNGSGSETVKKAAKKQITENGLNDTDLDMDLNEIEEDDIAYVDIDWCGAQTE